jgi:hypothetical protein
MYILLTKRKNEYPSFLGKETLGLRIDGNGKYRLFKAGQSKILPPVKIVLPRHIISSVHECAE